MRVTHMGRRAGESYVMRKPERLPRIVSVRERLEVRRAVDGNGCWNWMGHRDPDGYGRISIKRQARLVHRVSYEFYVGPIPAGLQLDHLCRNRACFNPEHLEPVTSLVNSRRSPISHAGKTHCPQGHPYDEVNTYVFRDRKSGKDARRCRQCKRDAYRRQS